MGSTGRAPKQQRSAQSRERAVAAATRLFLRDGYAATSMAAIAAEAGLAVQSLYVRFGSKAEVLRAAFEVAVVGDHDEVPLLDRSWVARVADEPDGPTAVRLMVRGVREFLERSYPLYAVMQGVADADVAALLGQQRSNRYDGLQEFTAMLSSKHGFARSDTEQLEDWLYALVSEDAYGMLVAERSWTPVQWETRCARLVSQLLFPGLVSSV